ncbi:unnamed protein product [Amoebophrya sp. A25]|nr:unnamed protein product [Amoebophrya sp. A25]|eukprot:GSA25T00008557001.1
MLPSSSTSFTSASRDAFAPAAGVPPRPRLLRIFQVEYRFLNVAIHILLILFVGLASAYTLRTCLGSFYLFYEDNLLLEQPEAEAAKHKATLLMLFMPTMVFFGYWNWLSKEFVRYAP